MARIFRLRPSVSMIVAMAPIDALLAFDSVWMAVMRLAMSSVAVAV